MSRPIGVLLAAGVGRRFDPTGQALKLLQPVTTAVHTGVPLVAAAARNLKSAVVRTLAVVRPRIDAHQSQLHDLLQTEGCELVICECSKNGIGASLACGVGASLSASAWIVALGDMPSIDPSVVDAVAQALVAGHATAAPAYRGQRGHPVGFAACCLDDLLACNSDHGASAVLQKFPPHIVVTDDAGVLVDIDTR